MEKRYLSYNDVCKYFNRSRTTILRLMKRKKNPFPQPVQKSVGGRGHRWLIDDVKKWEEKSLRNDIH